MILGILIISFCKRRRWSCH